MDDEKRPRIIVTILELKSREPFLPFEIVLTSGDKFLIENGDNLVELKTEFFYARVDGESFVFLRKSEIAAVQVPEKKRRSRRKAS